MKKLLVLVLTMVMASSAFAVVDPDPNMMGIYFDLNADVVNLPGAAPFSTIPAYVMVTNPNFDALYGYEFGYAVVGNGMMMNVVLNGPGAINVGTGTNYVVGLGSPLTTTEATLVATMNFFYMDATGATVTFDLMPSEPSSNDLGLPTLLLANDQLITVGFSNGTGLGCATVNGSGDIVATETVTIDAVKSLYR
jgi:hypothetical protein